ncbi:hypothetical protein LEP1GSC021_1594 [Leptospira noguchii str. 1993005606]|uniref:Uncharacterized protein n=1 Tax=Leptospira noguchii str. 2007001578 TaxID=1049974 RepID=A0ABP2TC14_9LEPT|nr:hypothetical protein LEP1GSC035_1730 [Leptospira noguchii str. 2007001578]EPE83434.1 hypothetical protein LEP1GSC021_1594 [Leptospira noguchii str. 1993005606]
MNAIFCFTISPILSDNENDFYSHLYRQRKGKQSERQGLSQSLNLTERILGKKS